MLVVAALEASQGQVIALEMKQADGAQSLQVIVNVVQDFIVTFTGIS